MAGSYNHVVTNDGGLRNSRAVLNQLDTHSGDVYEAIAQMYGMIWYLAHEMASLDGDYANMKAYFVEEAEKNYKLGLEASPTKRFRPQGDDFEPEGH